MTPLSRGSIAAYTYQPFVIENGQRVAKGRKVKLWKFSVNVAGKQIKRTGFQSKTEAEVALANLRNDTLNPPPVAEAAPQMTLGQAFERF